MVVTRARAAFVLAAIGIFAVEVAWAADAEMTNLALHKTATASSSEEANPPQNAVDGDPDTRWCNSDSSADAWWQVDLGTPQLLGGCEITWEHDSTVYKYVVEGSADGKSWTILNDQRGSRNNNELQKLSLLSSKDPVRYLRVRTTELEDGSWASFFEVKVFDAASIGKLGPDAAKAFAPSAPVMTTTAPAATAPN